MVMGSSVIAYFCLNWCMAQLSPWTATLPDSFLAPNQTKPNLKKPFQSVEVHHSSHNSYCLLTLTFGKFYNSAS